MKSPTATDTGPELGPVLKLVGPEKETAPALAGNDRERRERGAQQCSECPFKRHLAIPAATR